MLLLSVIVPVYNGADCIVRCLDSIYTLPLKENEFEVIVIDDCSQDNTFQIINCIAEKHRNMFIFHQEKNQRQGAARNRGIDIAKGEYLSFVDADDWILEDGYMNALRAVAESHVEICYFEFEYEHSDTGWTLCKMPKETHNTIMRSSEYLNKYYTCCYNCPTRNLYRTEFLRSTGIRFVEGVRWEDCDWTVKVYAKAREIQFVDGVGYRYAFNAHSTSSLKSSCAMAERIYAGSRLIDYAASIRHSLPCLSKTLELEGRHRYVINELRLRNVTKYSFRFIREMYDNLGVEKRKILCIYSWPIWTEMMIRYRILSLMILFASCPVAAAGRFCVSKIRQMV